MNHRNELVIPDAANRDPKSFELLRVWVANKAQHISLQAGVWEDPAAWGIMLADLARHVANSYHQDKGLHQSQSPQRIKAAFDAELESPTDHPSGSLT